MLSLISFSTACTDGTDMKQRPGYRSLVPVPVIQLLQVTALERGSHMFSRFWLEEMQEDVANFQELLILGVGRWWFQICVLNHGWSTYPHVRYPHEK